MRLLVALGLLTLTLLPATNALAPACPFEAVTGRSDLGQVDLESATLCTDAQARQLLSRVFAVDAASVGVLEVNYQYGQIAPDAFGRELHIYGNLEALGEVAIMLARAAGGLGFFANLEVAGVDSNTDRLVPVTGHFSGSAGAPQLVNLDITFPSCGSGIGLYAPVDPTWSDDQTPTQWDAGYDWGTEGGCLHIEA